MGVGSAFGADAQSSVVVEPGEGAFDGPAFVAESGSVSGVAAGDDRGDAEVADEAAVLVVVVAAVAVDPFRPAQGSSTPAADRWDGLISGMSWVMSLRLPPVRITASGIPLASVIRWCFEPGFARSTGLGPVWSPL